MSENKPSRRSRRYQDHIPDLDNEAHTEGVTDVDRRLQINALIPTELAAMQLEVFNADMLFGEDLLNLKRLVDKLITLISGLEVESNIRVRVLPLSDLGNQKLQQLTRQTGFKIQLAKNQTHKASWSIDDTRETQMLLVERLVDRIAAEQQIKL